MRLSRLHRGLIIAGCLLLIFGLGILLLVKPTVEKIEETNTKIAAVEKKIEDANKAIADSAALTLQFRDLFAKVQIGETKFYPEYINSMMMETVETTLKDGGYVATAGIRISGFSKSRLTLSQYDPTVKRNYELRTYTILTENDDSGKRSGSDTEVGRVSPTLRSVMRLAHVGWLSDHNTVFGKAAEEDLAIEEKYRMKNEDGTLSETTIEIGPEEFEELMETGRTELATQGVELGYFEASFKLNVNYYRLMDFIDYIDGIPVATIPYISTVNVIDKSEYTDYNVRLGFFVINNMQDPGIF
ncbi:hypothetical protein FACS189499_05940 [Clostridia bacterium]|nr:hypothetical protein FACS189499_05940 [Clostridia bacterium]